MLGGVTDGLLTATAFVILDELITWLTVNTLDDGIGDPRTGRTVGGASWKKKDIFHTI